MAMPMKIQLGTLESAPFPEGTIVVEVGICTLVTGYGADEHTKYFQLL